MPESATESTLAKQAKANGKLITLGDRAVICAKQNGTYQDSDEREIHQCVERMCLDLIKHIRKTELQQASLRELQLKTEIERLTELNERFGESATLWRKEFERLAIESSPASSSRWSRFKEWLVK